jgi:hypothetical protein
MLLAAAARRAKLGGGRLAGAQGVAEIEALWSSGAAVPLVASHQAKNCDIVSR